MPMNKVYKCFCVSVVLLLACLQVEAQSQQVTGTVKDEAGITMPGVNVIRQGTATGAVTDVNGKYVLMAEPKDVLIFSFIGYKSQTVVVGEKTNIDLVLEVDIQTLNEIVVIGYGEASLVQSLPLVARTFAGGKWLH
jgi:hypothetical protein